jgi:hypothetical protein
LRFGAVSSIDVALRMLVESSVSDLLRSTLRVALYDMVDVCGRWPRGVAGSLEGGFGGGQSPMSSLAGLCARGRSRAGISILSCQCQQTRQATGCSGSVVQCSAVY